MVQTALQFTLKTQQVDESFSQGMVTSSLLLLLFDRNRISYAIIDKQRQKAVALKDYHIVSDSTQSDSDDYKPGAFTQLLEMDELLHQLQPQQVILSVYSTKHSLVPNPLFSKDQLKDILSLTSRIKDDDRFYADAVPSANAHLVYAVPEELLKETGTIYKEAALYFAGSSFIENQLRLHKHESTPAVAVMVRPLNIDIAITHGSELKFFNSFPYQSSEDLIYYLLFSIEQLQLNADQVAVVFYGEIEKTSSHWMLAGKYIRNIRLGERTEVLEYSYGFDRLSAHQYVGLFNQYLCAL
ncbi:MAG: DUF3822 family protein [Bacteroidetes bacterium]|nr:DUF3822 family protein [Bacteroidota bacterium]